MTRALLIGHRGGVGASLLHLLENHPISLAALFLVDREAGPPYAHACVLEPTAATDPESLARTLRDHRIDQVIEVADVDTRATSEVCAAAGADYLSASVVGDAPTMIATRELLARRDARGTSQLIGAGMNPGIVNALVLVAVDQLARRARVPIAELELCAIHVVEEDTTAARVASGERHTGSGRMIDDLAFDPDVFAMSWSPEHALEELLEPHAMFVANGGVARLDHRPCDARYAARCGDREIAGMLVPHEELVAIASRFPGLETAFFYAIPELAAAALRRHPDRRPADWSTRRLYGPYGPHVGSLVGHDRVGVLIASQRYGELWLGYEHAAATRGAGNGTLLQAAAGVLAGWSLLGSQTGIHTTDELDMRAYLAIVESVLGPHDVCYAPDAIPRTIAERRILAGGSLAGDAEWREWRKSAVCAA